MGYPGNSKPSAYPGAYATNQQNQPPPTYPQNPKLTNPPYSHQPTAHAPPGGMAMPMPAPEHGYLDPRQASPYPLQAYPPQAPQAYPPQAYPQAYPPQAYPQPSQQAYSQPSQQAYPQPSQQAYPQPSQQAYSQPSQQAYPTKTQQSHSNTPPPATFENLAGGSSGQKKALLVGINYAGSKCPLRGCINDVHNMIDFLTRCAGFPRQNMVVLTDDNTNNPKLMPTRQNIMTEMQRLARGARKGDSLFFHFSGHGGQQKDTSGDEEDGSDETILPVDFQKAGMIVDDEIHRVLVKQLPAGCRLTCVFDSCHSGTALDLPYVYLPSGELKKRKTHSEKLLATAGQAGLNFLQGNKAGAVKTLFQMLTPQKKVDHQKVEQAHQSQADVIQFSGCKDNQTSADALIGGRHTGAMSYALLKSLRQNPSQSYSQLLTSTREVLAKEYSQIPQLSSGKLLDMNQAFRL